MSALLCFCLITSIVFLAFSLGNAPEVAEKEGPAETGTLHVVQISCLGFLGEGVVKSDTA